ncbi:PREDICTED: TNF receptor-associated factor 2-like [Amphimedon queenslandica]|uniref:RING-type domain-containing protein n=1 Tax=Amphimedon queenslandica TaxID=400682 RepID=A0A1X7VF38_AMPQE|nr:PREDICTED: TNF receptor-associated factor 2-like [Amphimedon queenslandica]|eukprot:XP_011410400.1 PREDICTED: TNF receptor-associated factor 2-like [Amphimedon queenslandica]
MSKVPSSPSSPPPVSSGWSSLNFVSPSPPESLICPICLSVLKDPYITDCCGNHFCHYCIDRVETCPLCRKTNFKIFPNLEKKREVSSIPVYCIHREKGCGWSGPLGRLFETHLPMECQFVPRPCPYNCGASLLPIDVGAHEDSCPKVTLDALVHKMKAEQINLGISMMGFIGRLAPLVEEVAILKEENKGLREEMGKVRDGLKAEIVKVLESQDEIRLQLVESRGRADILERENSKMAKRIDELSKKLEATQAAGTSLNIQEHSIDGPAQSISELESKLNLMTLTCTSVPPLTLVLSGFYGYKTSGTWWQSRPFYSHPCGYKFRMEVKPSGSGSGSGTHISVYVHVMKGEFDEKLKWPLNAVVNFRLIDQSPANRHFESKVSFSSENEASNRVTGDRIAGTGRGYSQFLPLVQVIGGAEGVAAGGSGIALAQFLKGDTIVFEIVQITCK